MMQIGNRKLYVIKKEDITLAPERMIIHGCNAQGVMGAGVAKAIRASFPSAYIDYRQAFENGELVPGVVVFSDCGDKIIGNCITQRYYGRRGKYVDYKMVERCLRRVISKADELGIKKIATSAIGCSLGGGSINEFIKTIKNAANYSGVEFTIYDMKG